MTTGQAKAQLLEAARRADPGGWVKAHPYETVVLGLLIGFIAGSKRHQRLMPLLQALANLVENVTAPQRPDV